VGFGRDQDAQAGECHQCSIDRPGNHRLRVSLIQGSNDDFDQAVLEAYRSLNGNIGLQFPVGTQRTVLDYDTAHIQNVSAPTVQFHSTTIHGDVEQLQ
jgi:hypothetical protein